jgi:signal peptidase I
MRDLKIVAAFLLGSVLVGVPGAATALVAAPVHIPSVYLQSIVSPRVLGFLASNPEESRGKEAKLSLHVDRIVYRFKMPERFDFVSYVSPPEQQPSEGKGTTNGETSLFSWRSVSQLAGRIVGLPEDSVELVQGRLRINGQFWAEPYIPDEFQAKVSLPLTHLGTSEYLILPDNRALLESQKEIPVVHHSRITGRILLVKWPMGWSFYRPTAFLHAYPLSSGNTPN